MQPAVRRDHFDGLVLALPVTAHHLWTFDADFADLAGAEHLAVVVLNARPGGGDRHADRAVVFGQIERVHAGGGRSLGQPVGLDQSTLCHFFPFFRHCSLHCHAAAERQAQVGEIECVESGRVEQAVEQRIDAGEHAEPHFRQFLDEARHIARIGDQQAHAAELDEHEAIRGQCKDVIQRNRGDHDLLADSEVAAEPGAGLQHVRDHVAMGQHRALGHARGAAGVLQERDIVVTDFDVRRRLQAAERQRVVETHFVVDLVWRHHLFHVPHDEVGDQRFRETEHVAERGRDYVLDHRCLRQNLRQRCGEVVEHDDGARAGVVQLMLELARGVKRVGVDHRKSGTQDAERRDRVLQHVRQHDRDAVALAELEVVEQVRRKLRAEPVDVAIAQQLAHVGKSGAVAELVERGDEHVSDRFVGVDVNLFRYA